MVDIVRERDQWFTNFTRMLIAMNQAIASSQDAMTLLQTCCDIALRYAPLTLILIGHPDEFGDIHVVAASGKTDYVKGIVPSIDATKINGTGPIGVAWREESSVFVSSIEKDELLAPWRSRLLQFSIRSTATMLIHRHGEKWGVMCVYLNDENVFDSSMKSLLEEVALDISRGLDHVDLVEKEQRLFAVQQALLDNTLCGISMVKNRRFIYCNEQFAQMLGYPSSNEIMGKDTAFIYPDKEQYDKIGLIYENHIEFSTRDAHDVLLLRQDGRVITCEVSLGVATIDGELTSIWTIRDITERKKLEIELERNLKYAYEIFENNATAIYTTDANRKIQSVNTKFCAILGYSRHEIIDKNARILHIDENAYFEFGQYVSVVLEMGSLKNLECSFRRKDGNLLTVELVGAKIHLQNGLEGIVWSVIDITERKASQNQMYYHAIHDSLTNLPNRRALDQELAEAFQVARKEGTGFAVCILDLDDFKPVNDTFGHLVGDMLLQHFSSRLLSYLREEDFLARLGGDEFVVVMKKIDPLRYDKDLPLIFDRLHKAIEQPFEFIKDRPIEIRLSLGAAVFPFDGQDAITMLEQADIALARAKNSKLNRKDFWQLASKSVEKSQEVLFDPYGLDATDILSKARDVLESISGKFWRPFYRELRQIPPTISFLLHLRGQENDVIKFLFLQLDFALEPEISRETLMNKAMHAGRMHYVYGISIPMLTFAISVYRRVLAQYLNFSPIPARYRYRLTSAVESRLQDVLIAQAQVEIDMIREFHALQAPPQWTEDTFEEFMQRECEAILRLPFIKDVKVSVDEHVEHRTENAKDSVSFPFYSEPLRPAGWIILSGELPKQFSTVLFQDLLEKVSMRWSLMWSWKHRERKV